MAELSARADGVRSLVGGVRQLADYLRDGAPEGAESAAELVAARAIIEAPKRSGRLVNATGTRGAAIVSAVPYARPVHARNPYVSRAWAQLLPRVVDAFGTDIQSKLDRL